MSSGKWRPFCLSLDELISILHPVITLNIYHGCCYACPEQWNKSEPFNQWNTLGFMFPNMSILILYFFIFIYLHHEWYNTAVTNDPYILVDWVTITLHSIFHI